MTIAFTGNLVDAPELRFFDNGGCIAKFRVAENERYLDRKTNEWKDGDATFHNVIARNQLAENIAASLAKGSPVTVIGKLRQRSYETREGEKRSLLEVHAISVGLDLSKATVNGIQRSTSANRQQGQQAPAQQQGAAAAAGPGRAAAAGPGRAAAAAAGPGPAAAVRGSGRPAGPGRPVLGP